MKLVQYFLPGKGKRVGLIQGDRVLDITSSEEAVLSTLDLVTQGKTAAGMVSRATWLAKRLHRRALEYRELQQAPSRRLPHLVLPIDSPEIWGAAGGGESGTGGAESGARPALFFKGTATRAVGSNAPVAIRHDSRLTVPEAGLAAVLGADGAAVAFTACDDVTARDIALGHPGFLSQAKIYRGSFALGPCLVTPDEFGDPRPLQVRCSILRGHDTIFSEAVATVELPRRLAVLAIWLGRDNPVSPGTAIFAEAGIEIPDALAIQVGDRVDVEIQGVGRLSNPVGRKGTPTR
jgi:2-dehydro-3-deoxy-D-arabinonate dehydratase